MGRSFWGDAFLVTMIPIGVVISMHVAKDIMDENTAMKYNIKTVIESVNYENINNSNKIEKKFEKGEHNIKLVFIKEEGSNEQINFEEREEYEVVFQKTETVEYMGKNYRYTIIEIENIVPVIAKGTYDPTTNYIRFLDPGVRADSKILGLK